MNNKVLGISGAFAAVAVAGGIGALVLMEDRDAAIKETYGIDPAQSCASLNPQSEYHRQNDALARLQKASNLAALIGPVGNAVAGKLNNENPICFAATKTDDLEAGGVFQRYLVVNELKSSAWLTARFANQEIAGIESANTYKTNRYVTEDALFFERIRHAVPNTYQLYVHYTLAKAEMGDNAFTHSLWDNLKNDPALAPAAKAFEQAIAIGAEPRKAWMLALESYLVTPAALNAKDINFLNWYKNEVGEQRSNIDYTAECYVDGEVHIDIDDVLPDGVETSDVITAKIEDSIVSSCESEIDAEYARVESEVAAINDEIASLESELDTLEARLEDARTEAEVDSYEASIRYIESSIQSLVSEGENIRPQDQSFSDYVTVYHGPAFDVHSLGFDARTLVNYVEHVTGEPGFLSMADAERINGIAGFVELHSPEAETLYRQALDNAGRWAADNYDPEGTSLNEGLRLRP